MKRRNDNTDSHEDDNDEWFQLQPGTDGGIFKDDLKKGMQGNQYMQSARKKNIEEYEEEIRMDFRLKVRGERCSFSVGVASAPLPPAPPS